MNTTNIRPGDLVQIDVRGARGFGRVVEGRNGSGKIKVEPFQIARTTMSFVPARLVTARQIIGHYRRMRGSAA